MMLTSDDRIKSLEEATAHNAAAIDDISTQMADQWAAIRRLEGKLDLIVRHLQEMRAQEQDGEVVIGKPPHY